MQGVVHRMWYGVHSSCNDRDHAQQPLTGHCCGDEHHRESETELADISGQVFVVRRQQRDPRVSGQREAAVEAWQAPAAPRRQLSACNAARIPKPARTGTDVVRACCAGLAVTMVLRIRPKRSSDLSAVS